ncbi:MAG: hypothetical protein K2X77_22130 [Candidatus Obscuribacterales bacterium]|nr:hypothetical protein [Candidatus Obscuribacterales bacterium]
MAIISMRSRKRALEIGLSALLCVTALLIQLLVLNNFTINGVICNLPLTVIIVWGLVFGTTLPPLTNVELRRLSMGDIFSRQLASGSISGMLVGWFFSWMNINLVPVYPIAYPIIGWASGYFCLRALSQGNLLCIPLVFILTLIGEGITAWEIFAVKAFIHQGMDWRIIFSQVFDHLSLFILTEALLNALIAPFIYFPMRRWYELVEGQQSYFPID